MSQDVREQWDAGATAAAETARSATADAGLAPPADVRAEVGRGHVTLTWTPVHGAMGYQVLAGEDPDQLEVLDHGGGDLLAVPLPPYVDTSGTPGRTRHYAVASLATVEEGRGTPSATVAAAPDAGDDQALPLVRADVDLAGPTSELARPWWMIGAEHVSTLRDTSRPGPSSVGDEYAAALRRMHDEVGVSHVRCHAILDEDNTVVRHVDGEFVVDATHVIDLYERLADLGLRPVVELGFMPRVLATDPTATVFTYAGIVSPPTDWEAWGRVVGDLVRTLVDHFGLDEVAQWPFEIWNEANLDVFWTGTHDDYLLLYDHAARAVKAVDERLLVGGPATAAVGWIGSFLDHVVDEGAPLDFLTTHVYGVPPLALRPALAARGLEGVRTWWTEWGITPTHHHPVNDSVFGAPFVLAGMKAATDVADALSYWVATDHFEELGRPSALLHGGFGLQTVGNLRKPRYWALALAHQQGDELLPLALTGDGAGGLVDGWASRHDDGTVDVLLWNGTLDQSRVDGSPDLARRVVISLADAGHGMTASVARVDHEHSNVAANVDRRIGGRDWPDDAAWDRLVADDRLAIEDLGWLASRDGVVTMELALPMPGVVRVRATPASPPH